MSREYVDKRLAEIEAADLKPGPIQIMPAEIPKPRCRYVLHVVGPGMDTHISLDSPLDIEIAEAVLAKLRRTLEKQA